MIKKIKNYFAKKKEKKHLQKLIQCEVLETFALICSYLYIDGRRSHNEAARTMVSRSAVFKEFAERLRAEIIAEEQKNERKVLKKGSKNAKEI